MAQKQIHYNNKLLNISYELINHKKEKIILFLHGWGANKEIMKQAFGKYLSEYTHLYLDLPGFGNSSINEPLNSYQYKKIIEIFLQSVHVTPFIVIGHSFGGKIGTLLKPSYLVLLSSAGIVPKKSSFVQLKIATYKFAKFLGIKNMRNFFVSKDAQGMSETMYQTLKNVVNEKMEQEFESFQGKALIFWGIEDMATPIESGKIIHSLIKNSKFYKLQGDHFFFLNSGDFIALKIGEEIC